ncbi:MAG TPA: SLC13 family permease [Geminicoccaceae bacterium]
MTGLEPSLQMWLTLALAGAAIVAYASERVSIELTSVAILAALLLLFYALPLPEVAGRPALDTGQLLAGFGNPALVAVVALLVIGEAMVSTRALEGVARRLMALSGQSFGRALGLSLLGAAVSSAFLNNTPIAVIFIPILLAIAGHYGHSPSRVMLPLNYIVILGGMTTLIGSSTNLLVSGALIRIDQPPLRLFDPTIPGLVLAAAGIAYALFVLPLLLPKREARGVASYDDGRHFVTELDLRPDSALVGTVVREAGLAADPKVRVRLVRRGDQILLPPFGDLRLEAGDVLLFNATREALSTMLSQGADGLGPGTAASGERPRFADQVLVEAMVKPTSRMVGSTLDLTNFAARSDCTVLAVRRRARLLRARLSELRFEPGDVLLLVGRSDTIERLRADPDVLLMEWSASEVPDVRRGPLALLIFGAVVVPAALDLVPIVISALLGVLALITTGCLNIRQAIRAIDQRIILMIAAALALGTAMEATGGAAWLAAQVIAIMAGASPAAILSAFFLLIAVLTNVLSNNACAVLFTPIAVNLAAGLGAPVFPFTLAVIFGANCSFATPFGYQVNLLIMGPGQYRFVDFMRAGVPLILIIWLVFTIFVPWYYGL